jgi:hypothetical protein
MDPFSEGDLTIDVRESPDEVRLVWRGKSNARNPSLLLQPFFGRVLELSLEPKRTLQLELERLEHFNSSTISALIQLVHACRAKGVRLGITFDGRVKWQKLSFEALRVLAKPDGLFEVRSIA